ncbi:MAG: malto-oligosyltrehalose synthase [Acidobacteria bacterium]|nr:malto-oligosyltrehalose synthase [Acidobacteriota bacterium]
MSKIDLSLRPVTTYRLQFDRGFGFADARHLVPYLAELGVTECYCSPYLKANPGSRHGYDICEHGSLSPELGSEADYEEFCTTLQARGLGHILDFVPNHMAADPRSNPWWRDVLENGPSSPFAEFFDIDWDPIKPELKGKVLLPVLGDQYGRVLERGELQLRFQDGALHLWYFDLDLPINPRQSPRVLGLHRDRLEREMGGDPSLREYLSILTALHNLPVYTEREPTRIAERQREKEVARERLSRLVAESPRIRRHVEECIRQANGTPGDPQSFDVLHDLLENQAYRLANWRTAADEINYRRFFDINELVALRMEVPAVFEATHGLLKRLLSDGRVTGIRVDHPDGLLDPAAYFERLQQLTDRPLYVVVEKILSPGESLSQDWPIAGTTGYGFLNGVPGLFVDPRHVRAMRRLYTRITGRQESFEEVAYQSRRTIMLTAMASELNVLAHALNRLSEQDRCSRDFTLNNCRTVLREVVACFPVYRTYVSRRGASEFDRAIITTAIADARRRNPLLEASIFDFLRDILLQPALADASEKDPVASDRLRFAMKVQQFTAPVQAKGVEDTAFYRYHVLVSANDVGGHPGRLSVQVLDFHEMNRQRLEHWPLELIATSTHDTKRGEDARARIAVLSEMPDAWSKAVGTWMRINGPNRVKLRGAWAPDRNDEYLLYQIVIGAWPAEDPQLPVPDRAPADVADRIVAYMQKAAREAKVHTSWTEENPEYLSALVRFIKETLTGRTARRFLASFAPFQRRVARIGMVNSLAQLVLKLASPGVPDFYQGSELWDLSLVDPDNRRPVDFSARQQFLAALRPVVDQIKQGNTVEREVRDLLTHWGDGRIKLLVTTCGLRFRRQHSALMLDGAYTPLEVEGMHGDHVVAFARHDDSGTLLAVAPRLVVPLVDEGQSLPLGPAWGSSRIVLPAAARATRYRHVITGEWCEAAGSDHSHLPMATALCNCPVALLWAPAREERVQADAA